MGCLVRGMKRMDEGETESRGVEDAGEDVWRGGAGKAKGKREEGKREGWGRKKVR